MTCVYIPDSLCVWVSLGIFGNYCASVAWALHWLSITLDGQVWKPQLVETWCGLRCLEQASSRCRCSHEETLRYSLAQLHDSLWSFRPSLSCVYVDCSHKFICVTLVGFDRCFILHVPVMAPGQDTTRRRVRLSFANCMKLTDEDGRDEGVVEVELGGSNL